MGRDRAHSNEQIMCEREGILLARRCCVPWVCATRVFEVAVCRALLTAVLLIGGCNAQGQVDVRPGDIIFQTSTSSQSLAIQLATHSKFSHMGIILFRKGEPYVYEASGTVRFTPLAEWIRRGEGGRFMVKRLKNADEFLTPDNNAKLLKFALRYEGRPYDPYFGWLDERMYCSELVWKIYKDALGIEIGALQRLREFDLSSEAVRKKLQERYGEKIPLQEQVISPSEMFESTLLVAVP